MDMIKVIVMEPGKAPYVVMAPKTEQIAKQALWIQEEVHGFFKCLQIEQGFHIVLAEDCKNKKPNFIVPVFEDVVYGTAIFLNVDNEGNTQSLTDEQIDFIKMHFQNRILRAQKDNRRLS